ncbi:hypothetical protein ZYGNAAKF_CDS0181 [Enterococcus phage VRE9_2]
MNKITNRGRYFSAARWRAPFYCVILSLSSFWLVI